MPDLDAAPSSTSARDLLTLERIGEHRFRSCHFAENPLDFVFGGQPIGQALAAAAETAPGWRARSGSGAFLARGKNGEPIDYDVDLLRDGRELAVRRVRASQSERPIFEMLCSFGRLEEAQARAAAVTHGDPDDLPTLKEFAFDNRDRLSAEALRIYLHPFPVELKLVEPEKVIFDAGPQHRRSVWMRMPSAAAIDDAIEHQSLIAFMSDYWFASAVGSAGGAWSRDDVVMLTTNHSLWLHAPARADGWLLYETDVRFAAESGGLVTGSLYSRDGALVATAAQEVVFRRRRS